MNDSFLQAFKKAIKSAFVFLAEFSETYRQLKEEDKRKLEEYKQNNKAIN